MPRVSPEAEEEDDQPSHVHHHIPNTRHFKDVAHGPDKKVLVNFEQYTLRDSEDAEQNRQTPRRSNDSGGGTEGRHRRRRSRDQDRGDGVGYGPTYNSGQLPPPPASAPSVRSNQSKTSTQSSSTFFRCDAIAFGIVLAYSLCIASFVIAVWCYRHDTVWNGIVRTQRTFPEIPNEDFFGGKQLFLYEEDHGLRNAKKYLLRDNRWLELMHLLFLSGFLILTLFQLVAYVTRGDENHTKLIICYYTVFGGLGLLVAIFPLFSWYNQERNYIRAASYLQGFSKRQWRVGRKFYKYGLTNATAHDSWTLGAIMQFCYDASQDGLNLDKDARYFAVFKRRYRLSQLQTLGFCTLHKLKIIATIISTLFALVCCIIPCIYFFKSGESSENAEITINVHLMEKAEEGETSPPGKQVDDHEMDTTRGRPSGDSEGYPEHKFRSHYTGEGGRHLGRHARLELEKFKRYIESDDIE